VVACGCPRSDPMIHPLRYVQVAVVKYKTLDIIIATVNKSCSSRICWLCCCFRRRGDSEVCLLIDNLQGVGSKVPKTFAPQLSIVTRIQFNTQTHTMPEKAVVNSVLSSHAPCRPKRHHHYWHRHRYLTVCVRQKCRGVNGACWCFSLGGGNPGNCHNFLHHVTHSKWQDEVSGNI